jgi:hypothetical protein
MRTNRGEQRGAGGGSGGGWSSVVGSPRGWEERRRAGRGSKARDARVAGGRRGVREEEPPSREPLQRPQEKGVEGGIWVPP